MKLPPLNELLASGGDSRIVPDPMTGLNRYGCSVTPLTSGVFFGSCTASTIYPEGYAAAQQLYNQLLAAPAHVYAQEMERIRGELKTIFGLAQTDIVFAASGTDLHLLASQLASGKGRLLAILPELAETGSGVHDAMAGRHFSDCAAFLPSVAKSTPIKGAHAAEIKVVACRDADGVARASADIDSEVTALVEAAVARRRHVLLTLIDVSKTGLIAPSPACALALKERFPNQLDVLVDACQLRISASTLRAYLACGFLVAITGSKFAEGPAFCGALLVPEAASMKFAAHWVPAALSAYSAQGDWPEKWTARRSLNDTPNYGLLLRWEATLVTLRAFYALPEEAVTQFITGLVATMCNMLASREVFELLPIPELIRSPITPPGSWDTFPTIIPAFPRGATGHLSREETRGVYERLRADHYYIGQPVICGTGSNPISALRFCVGMRDIIRGLKQARVAAA